MTDILKFIGVILLVVIIIVLLGLVLMAATMPLSIAECNSATASIGFDNKFNYWSGCMIEVEPGMWIKLANYRYMDK